jgi:hypothetical protein
VINHSIVWFNPESEVAGILPNPVTQFSAGNVVGFTQPNG